jgi:hypothetical protein
VATLSDEAVATQFVIIRVRAGRSGECAGMGFEGADDPVKGGTKYDPRPARSDPVRTVSKLEAKMDAFCMMCGKPLVPGTRFCGECGAVAAEASPSSAEQPPVTPVASASVAASPTGGMPMSVCVPTPGSASNTVVWLLAFAPIIGGIAESIIARSADTEISDLWFITVLLTLFLCVFDARLLKRNGLNPPKMWAVFLIPVYLFKRATALGQNKAYFVVWIAAFLLSFGADRIVATALPYAEGEYHLGSTWEKLRLRPGRVMQHFIISGDSVIFKSRPEGPEYRLGLGDARGFTALDGHKLNLLDSEGPDSQAYHSSGAEKWVRCDRASDCVLTIYYTKPHSAVNSAAATALPEGTPQTATAVPAIPPQVAVKTPDVEAMDLRKFVGKVPDKTFWSKVDTVFEGTLMGQGSGGSKALDSFENGLDEYVFTPCQYDANTNTVTTTWKSVSKGVEGDIGGLPDIGAVSLDVNTPGTGIVVSWDGDASMSFYAGRKDISASDASGITRGDFRVLPPTLAEWAAALIKDSGKSVVVTVQ